MNLPEPFATRDKAFRGALDEIGLDGAVVSWPPHVGYLTGIVAEWAPAFLLVDPGRVTAVVPASASVADAAGIELRPYSDGSIEEIVSPRHNVLAVVARIVAERGIRPDHLGVERDHLLLSDTDAFPALSKAADVGPMLTRQRMGKDEQEIARIRTNLRVLEVGFDAARATIRPGVTELAVWAAMHTAMMAKAGSPFSLEGNFASGPRTLENEPLATNRRLEAGDVLFIDLYPSIAGYGADLTRTFVVGEPTPAQRERHAVLERALAAGVAALKPGIRACDVDRAINRTNRLNLS